MTCPAAAAATASLRIRLRACSRTGPSLRSLPQVGSRVLCSLRGYSSILGSMFSTKAVVTMSSRSARSLHELKNPRVLNLVLRILHAVSPAPPRMRKFHPTRKRQRRIGRTRRASVRSRPFRSSIQNAGGVAHAFPSPATGFGARGRPLPNCMACRSRLRSQMGTIAAGCGR